MSTQTEEVVANSVGDGKIAGTGQGPQGEPGVKKKSKSKVLSFKQFLTRGK